jgi:hypothetical protein
MSASGHADETPTVTPEQFFEQLLPLGFAQQVEANAAVPRDFTVLYRLRGEGGGEWLITIRDGKMESRKGAGEAVLTVTVSVDDWRDALLGRNGASLALLVPQGRPARPEATARVQTLRGTLVQELLREGGEPFRLEMTFNGAAEPRTVVKMKLQDFLDMTAGALNGQEAFMTGRMRVDGDMGLLMQLAALTI